MADRNKLIHLHSGVSDKQPSVSTIEYGEIAVNFNEDKPFISFKVSGDSEASIVMCRPTPSITDNGSTISLSCPIETLTVSNTLTTNSIVNNSTIVSYGDIKTINGMLVGQLISGTTITSPTISGTTITSPTISGTTITSPTISGTTITSPTISGTTITGPTISGTTITGPTISGTTITGPTISGTSVTSPTISGTSVTSPTISGTTITSPTISGTTITSPAIKSTTITSTIISGTSVTSPTISGTTFHASDGFYQDSDETLKKFDSDINVDLDRLKLIPKKYFYWKEGNNEKQIGTSAQKVQELYPEIVTKCASETLAVDYAKLSIIALAAIDKLNDKIKELEEEINELKK